MAKHSGAPRRVLIIVENLPVPFDRRVWAEATTLAAHGYQVSVISPMLKGYDKPYEELDGVHIYRHPLNEANGGAAGYFREYAGCLFHQFRLAFKIKRQRGFDVIHACNPPDLIFLVAAFFKVFFGVKFVFDHHDLCPELYEDKFGKRGFFHSFLLLVERLTFALADVSIATNGSYRQVAVSRGRMNPDDVFVVRSGPRLDKLKMRPPNLSLKKGFDHLVGYVGVIGEQEGLDLLVEAAYFLVQEFGHLDTHFYIIGDGPALPKVKALAQKKGLDDYFTFAGRVSDEVFLDVLNTADICVNSDRMSEMNDKSTMNKILEYMALGKPIVQFDLFEGRQSAGPASLYAYPDDPADFAEKMNTLLSDPERRRDMGMLGRERIVSRFSWEHSSPVLLRAYACIFERVSRSNKNIENAKVREKLRPVSQSASVAEGGR